MAARGAARVRAGAERDGFAELWLVEDCFLTGGLTMAAAALATTDAMTVGIGLLPAAMRNPAIAAMEIAGLERLHPGRFAAAFGHGVEPWMRQIGARPKDRVAALEETVAAVRALLAGETVTVDGRHVHLDDVSSRTSPPTRRRSSSAPPVRRRSPPPAGRPTASCCPRAASRRRCAGPARRRTTPI